MGSIIFENDTVLFFNNHYNIRYCQYILAKLYIHTKDVSLNLDTIIQRHYLNSNPYYQLSHYKIPLDDPEIPCSTAQVVCSDNTYTFPAPITGHAPPTVTSPVWYPNYGCINSAIVSNPAWYYMQVGQSGDIIISINSTTQFISFVCWGPFSSLSNACSNGLSGNCTLWTNPPCLSNYSPSAVYPSGNIVDCAEAIPFTPQTCHILNAQVGYIYTPSFK